jgi:hypothetical protein
MKLFLLFFSATLTAATAEKVTARIDLLAHVRRGEVDYHVNPTREVADAPAEIFKLGDDGVLRVSGRGYGYLATRRAYRDYRAVIEYSWGERTWGKRAEMARDTGLLVHAHGPHGALNRTWIASIEAQIIEGGTGDILVLAPKLADGTPLVTRVSAEAEQGAQQLWYWRPGAPRRVFAANFDFIGRRPRDPAWKETKGVRSAGEIERPPGEWNRLEVEARGTTLRLTLNGTLVNEAFDVAPGEGKVCLQTECAEFSVRRFELLAL